MSITAYVVTATLCLLAALVEAWLLVALVATRGGALHQLLKNREDLIRSHIDYLLMALFLYVFYGLSRVLSVAPASWMIAAACLGAVFNPFAFLVHALRPDFKEAPPPWFFVGMMASCVATTVGFAATALAITVASVR
jgi:hypothetical protein